MILICRSGSFGGIMGRGMFVSSAMNGWAVTEDAIRCKVFDGDFLPEYVFGYLGSLTHGYPIITAYRYGKDVPHLDPDELKSIPVPILAPDKQEQVARHVRPAFSNLDLANELEDQAQRELLVALKWRERETES